MIWFMRWFPICRRQQWYDWRENLTDSAARRVTVYGAGHQELRKASVEDWAQLWWGASTWSRLTITRTGNPDRMVMGG